MSGLSQDTRTETAWEDEIRMREEQACAAFLKADLAALEDLWSDGFAVNSPLQKVLTKRQVIEALRSGRIRHQAYDFDIELMSRHGEVVVVMGSDRVGAPPRWHHLAQAFYQHLEAGRQCMALDRAARARNLPRKCPR